METEAWCPARTGVRILLGSITLSPLLVTNHHAYYDIGKHTEDRNETKYAQKPFALAYQTIFPDLLVHYVSPKVSITKVSRGVRACLYHPWDGNFGSIGSSVPARWHGISASTLSCQFVVIEEPWYSPRRRSWIVGPESVRGMQRSRSRPSVRRSDTVRVAPTSSPTAPLRRKRRCISFNVSYKACGTSCLLFCRDVLLLGAFYCLDIIYSALYKGVNSAEC